MKQKPGGARGTHTKYKAASKVTAVFEECACLGALRLDTQTGTGFQSCSTSSCHLHCWWTPFKCTESTLFKQNKTLTQKRSVYLTFTQSSPLNNRNEQTAQCLYGQETQWPHWGRTAALGSSSISGSALMQVTQPIQ